MTPCADTQVQGNPFNGGVKYTRLGHQFQGQKVKDQGHQAALVGCSSHYIIYTDDNIFYATAQSEPLHVDHEYLWRKARCMGAAGVRHVWFEAGLRRTGAGHIVAAARLQLVKDKMRVIHVR